MLCNLQRKEIKKIENEQVMTFFKAFSFSLIYRHKLKCILLDFFDDDGKKLDTY